MGGRPRLAPADTLQQAGHRMGERSRPTVACVLGHFSCPLRGQGPYESLSSPQPRDVMVRVRVDVHGRLPFLAGPLGPVSVNPSQGLCPKCQTWFSTAVPHAGSFTVVSSELSLPSGSTAVVRISTFLMPAFQRRT